MPPPSKKSKTSHSKPKPIEQPKPVVELGGDDLDDNLLLDDSYLSPDDNDEGPSPTAGDDVEAYLSPDESEPSKKRPAPSSNEPLSAESKKAKKDKKKQASKLKKTAKLEELGLLGGGKEEEEEGKMDDTAILPLEVVLDRFSEKQGKVLKDLSGLELDEVRMNQTMFLDTSSVPLDSRRSLLTYMKEAIPTACTTLGKMPKAPGSPRVIVLSGAALRVADLCRDVKTFRKKEKDGTIIDVGKLFAKHFKLNEHAEYLNKTFVGIAVGTPNRIEKLLNETDSLKLTHLSHLILDTSHLDSKKRSLLDLPDARSDLFKLLGCEKVMTRLREGKMKVMLF